MTDIVTLTEYEARMAVLVGAFRNLEVIFRHMGRRNYVGNTEWQPWDCDIEAAGAEIAVAKLLGMYWDGSVNTFKAPDVGEYQIRHTLKDTNKLIVRHSDPADQRYVLVTGRIPRYRACGWIWGNEAKNVKYLQSDFDGPQWKFKGPPAYFIPQSDLLPMEALRQEAPCYGSD